jgi:hypothetical protein
LVWMYLDKLSLVRSIEELFEYKEVPAPGLENRLTAVGDPLR